MTAMGYGRRRERGMVLFIALILLLILTLLGVGLARTETTEERLAQNDNNHQIALQAAEAALQAGFDDDVDGLYAPADFSGATPGLDSLSREINNAPYTTLGYEADWSAPGVDTILYNGAALGSVPAAAQPQFVIEAMAPAVPPGCEAGNATGYPQAVAIHRITAHAAGGDGTASATVQTLHIGGC